MTGPIKKEPTPINTNSTKLASLASSANAQTEEKKNAKSISADTKIPVVLSSLGTEETELKAFFEQIILPKLRKTLQPYHDTLIPTALIRHFQDSLNQIEKEFREFSHKLEHTTHSLRHGDRRGFKHEVDYLENDLPKLKQNIATLVKEVELAVKAAEQEVVAQIKSKPKKQKE